MGALARSLSLPWSFFYWLALLLRMCTLACTHHFLEGLVLYFVPGYVRSWHVGMPIFALFFYIVPLTLAVPWFACFYGMHFGAVVGLGLVGKPAVFPAFVLYA